MAPPSGPAVSFFHPQLDLALLKKLDTVRQLILEHPSYFAEAPYPLEVEQLLVSWFSPEAVRLAKVAANKAQDKLMDANAGDLEDDRWHYLYVETKNLYENLKLAKYNSSEDGDSMSYYKTMASLQERLIGYQERALGMKQISEHYKVVLNIVDRVFSPTQRTEFMDELKKALGQ